MRQHRHATARMGNSGNLSHAQRVVKVGVIPQQMRHPRRFILGANFGRPHAITHQRMGNIGQIRLATNRDLRQAGQIVAMRRH